MRLAVHRRIDAGGAALAGSGVDALRALRASGGAGRGGDGFAVMIGVLSGLYYHDARLGTVIGLAMVGNMTVAAFAGVLIPIGLEKVGADPALASGTFVTTITDVFGFFAFLGLASVMLM